MTTQNEGLNSMKVLPVDWIEVEAERQRQYFPEGEMQELRDSILSAKGLMCPILVRPTNKDTKYKLVAGERRLRTITAIQEPYRFGDELIPPGNIPVVVKYFDTDMDAAEAELHENIVRLDLTWQEKAQAIARLHHLKVKLNPKHTKAMTVDLVDDQSAGEEPSRRTAVQGQVNAALLVADFLSDPDVQKAKNLREASKVASRKIEEEALLSLQKKQAELAKELEASREKAEAKRAAEGVSADDFDLLAEPPKPKAAEKLGLLLKGDLREKLQSLAPRSINVMIADPPYGMDAHKFDDGGRGTQAHDYDDSREYSDEIHAALITQMSEFCAENAHAYIFCDFDYYHTLRDLMLDRGWWVRRRPLVWHRGVGKLADGTPTGYTSTNEYILFATYGERKCSQAMPDMFNIRDDRHKHHAAQKPVELYKTLLKMSGVPGDRVLDPCAGSGTIFKACRGLHMEPIGIELNEKFQALCELAQQGKEEGNYDLDGLV